MPSSTTTLAPTAAERVRNACANAETAVLALPGVDPVPTTLHHLRACGDAVVAVPTTALAAALAATANETPAVVEITDHAPLPVREPVRALVWLRGWVRQVPPGAQRALAGEIAKEFPHPSLLDVGHTTTLLRVLVNSAVLADATGAESVDHTALRAARKDPFCEMEAAWLQHLSEDHADVVEALTRHVPAELRSYPVHPLALDRFGLTLRVEGTDGDHDVRLPFLSPATDVESLSYAVQLLCRSRARGFATS
ncbi:DUF2470 domain-containing protein [Nocardia thailandica]|uniref:DUF2470 domain-containing protein n=1 Tax=Nocardia thailandica TaxID=257275 RepID=A0ABW6PGR9_9NOCA|nr:DUF2470 domain-containing protein [Nocardia thailandica]